MNPLRFTRRNLLRGSLAATATIPFLEARRVDGQQAAPTRFVVFSTPNGTRNSLFWPTGSESSFTLPLITKPLEAFKPKLTFLKGIRLNDALQNGQLGGTVGSEHARGTGGMLTARPLKSSTQFKSFMSTSGWGTGQSLDQYLAERLNPMTTFKSLQLGVHVRDAEVRGRISYAGADRPLPPRENPKDVFMTLFGGATGGTPGATVDPALERLWAQRKSVFDLTKAETDRIKQLVGVEDRSRLETHLAAVRDIEQRLVKVSTPGMPVMMPAASCTRPAAPESEYKEDVDYAAAGKLQMDLAAAALACDQTRIMTFQWSYSESEHLFSFLNISGDHHNISHDFALSGTNYDAYNKIQTWYAEQFAYFLGKLDSYKEGERTLLDNTIVLWATEIGESTRHELATMPYVLAGSAGGKIRAGRFIDYGNNQRDNNQMLVSIAHAMGATDLMNFGDASGAAGPLANLA